MPQTGLTRRRFLLGTAGAAGALAAKELRFANAQPASTRQFAGTTLNGMFFETAFSRGLEKLLAEFEQLTGIKVQMDIRGFAVFVQQADLELSGATGKVDVMNLAFANSGRWMAAGWATQLDTLIKRDSFDLDDFVSGPLEAVKYKGSTYAIPMFADSHLMMYRKDLIPKPPETFDELLAAASKVHSPQVGGYLAGGLTALNWTFPVFQMGFGGKPFANPPADMTPLYDRPETISAADYWAGTLVRKYGVPGFASADTGEIIAAAVQGRAAIWTEALGILSAAQDRNRSRVADKVAYAPDPRGPAGWYPQVATHGMMIPAASRNAAAAWEFVKWATSRPTMLRIALTAEYATVVRQSVMRNPDFRKKYTASGSDIPAIHEEALKRAAAGYMAYRVQPEFPPITSRVVIALTEIISSQKSAKDAMTDAQRDIVQILTRAGRLPK